MKCENCSEKIQVNSYRESAMPVEKEKTPRSKFTNFIINNYLFVKLFLIINIIPAVSVLYLESFYVTRFIKNYDPALSGGPIPLCVILIAFACAMLCFAPKKLNSFFNKDIKNKTLYWILMPWAPSIILIPMIVYGITFIIFTLFKYFYKWLKEVPQ